MATSNDTTQTPYGYCQCGCGQKTKIATGNRKAKGWIKGEPYRFISGHYSPPFYTEDQWLMSFWSNIAITADDNKCWLWQGALSHGYGSKYYQGRTQNAQRIAWMLPDYIIPNDMDICHSCDNRACCNPKHLFLGTRQDNIDDMVAKKRHPRGEQKFNAKLTYEAADIIRERRSSGDSVQSLADEFNVSVGSIYQVIKGETWFK